MPLWLQILIGLTFGIAADIGLLWLARRYLGLRLPEVITITIGKAELTRVSEASYWEGYSDGYLQAGQDARNRKPQQ